MVLAFVLAATGAWLRAEDQPPAPAPEAPAALTAEQRAEAARVEAEKALAAAEAVAAQARVDAEKAREAARAEAKKARDDVRTVVADAVENAVEEAAKQLDEAKDEHKSRASGHGDRVAIGDDNHIPAGVTVPHNAVAVMGDLTVDGEVMHDAVAVMGDNRIDVMCATMRSPSWATSCSGHRPWWMATSSVWAARCIAILAR